MHGPWQNTADPELEWRLHRPFLAIVLGTCVTGLVLDGRYYSTAGAWLDWGLRTFWILYLPLLLYIRRRWRHYVEATSAIRPEPIGGRDPNRITYWLFAALALPLTLILFCGQAVVFSSALVCEATPVMVAGPVTRTTTVRRAEITIRSRDLGDVAIEVPRRFAAANGPGSHVSLEVQRGCLDILHYTTLKQR